MRFVNRGAFDDPKSRQAAMGVDFRTQNAVLDPSGKVLFYAQTGGVLNPQRFELVPGDGVFRFGSASVGPQKVAKGGWWLEKAEFGRLVNFANVWSIAVSMAARALCLVPPEWSDMTLLVRGRVSDPLLAWRGLERSRDAGRGGWPTGSDADPERHRRAPGPSALRPGPRRAWLVRPGNPGRAGLSAGQERRLERISIPLRCFAAGRPPRGGDLRG